MRVSKNVRHPGILLLIPLLWSAAAVAVAQDRIALVVGNARYEKASMLDNTTNDATDVAAALRGLGFRVLLHKDIRTRGEFREAVRGYREALAGGRDSIGLFFYAGHAVQVNGENYLIPTAADLRDIPDLDIETLSLGYVTAMAGDAGNPVNFFLIDACRDNPFRGFSRSLNRGLAVTDTPEGSVIVYAASPGRVASDGSGRNSPFTANLLQQIGSPEHVLLMLQNVVKGVRQDTKGQQLPWFHTSLTGDFYFNPAAVADAVAEQAVESVASTEGPVESAASPATVADDSGQSRVADPVASLPTSVATAPTPAGTAGDGTSPSEIVMAAVDPEPGDAGHRSLRGVWNGRLRNGDGPGAAVTLETKRAAGGGYEVAISRLISYGEVPASCTFASGRMVALDQRRVRLELVHPGCRGAGELRLRGDTLSGTLNLDGRDIALEMTRR